MSRNPTGSFSQGNTQEEIDAIKEELAALKLFCFNQIPRRIGLINPLHKAAFNADLDGVKKHLESISPAARKKLLSTKNTVLIEHLETRYPNTTHTVAPLQMAIFDDNEKMVGYFQTKSEDSAKFHHPGITRTGTPLQMAIFDDDEEMAAYFQTQMDPDEFHRQCREVFVNAINGTTDAIKLALKDEIASLQKGNIITADYFTLMREVQKKEAEVLCADSKKILTDANPDDFMFEGKYIDENVITTSKQLEEWVNNFIKQKILGYVKTHPIHNPYLLQTAYDIYVTNTDLHSLDHISPQFYYFVYKIIGGVQSFLSPRWLNHFTQNIDDLANNRVTPHRSFTCAIPRGNPQIGDANILALVADCIGEDAYLMLNGFGKTPGPLAKAPRLAQMLRNLCQTKTANWNTLLCSQPEHVPVLNNPIRSELRATNDGIASALQALGILGGRNNDNQQQKQLDVPHRIHFSSRVFAPIHITAFNADLCELKQHLESIRSPAARKSLLSEKGSVCIEHLEKRYPNITRIGTALQMAIFDDDEEMVGYFQTQMDPDEFHRQCREVFESAINGTTDAIKLALKDEIASLQEENVTTADYFALMREVQKKEAELLCADLNKMFTDVYLDDFTCGSWGSDGGVARTASTQLQDWVDEFIKQKLLDYVKTHPVHNPYILQTVYDIYATLPAPYESKYRYNRDAPNDFMRDCYFSEKIIGGVQSFLPPRWLTYYAQDIRDFGENKVVLYRSFLNQDGDDIRHVVVSRIGESAFLHILPPTAHAILPPRIVSGRASCERIESPKEWGPSFEDWFLRDLCRVKTANWKTLLLNNRQSELAPAAMSLCI